MDEALLRDLELNRLVWQSRVRRNGFSGDLSVRPEERRQVIPKGADDPETAAAGRAAAGTDELRPEENRRESVFFPDAGSRRADRRETGARHTGEDGAKPAAAEREGPARVWREEAGSPWMAEEESGGKTAGGRRAENVPQEPGLPARRERQAFVLESDEARDAAPAARKPVPLSMAVLPEDVWLEGLERRSRIDSRRYPQEQEPE